MATSPVAGRCWRSAHLPDGNNESLIEESAIIQIFLAEQFPLTVRVPPRAFWQLPLMAVIMALIAGAVGIVRRVRQARGSFPRPGPGGAAGTDRGPFANPLYVTVDGYVYDHEVGVNHGGAQRRAR